jgi:peptidyl-prolyl cis-trans isomerase SurA
MPDIHPVSMRHGRLLAAALAMVLVCAAVPAQAQSAARSRGQPVDRIIAIVNQEAITAGELEQRISIIEGQAREAGRALPAKDELRRQVLEQMIVMRAQLQYAATVGLKPTEGELDRAVTEIAQRNGVTVQQFGERLSKEGLSMSALREQVSGEITALRLREREATNKVTISEAEVDAQLARSGNAGAVEYDIAQILLRLPNDAPADVVRQKTALAEEIAGKARANGDFNQLAREYSEAPDAMQGGKLGWRSADRLPDLFVNAVSGLKPGEVSPVLRSPAGLHVLRLVDRRSESPAASTVNQTHVRHILLPGGSAATEAESKRRLAEFRNQVETGGADFGDLARQFSTDGSAREGGDLGWLFAGETVPPFERAMDALQPGQISQPVVSQFGVHLIQVLERRADASSPDRLRAMARQNLREQKANEAYDQWLRELRDRAYVELRLEQS